VYKKHLCTGKSGEELAMGFLKENGYKILARNYKTKLGEIDIVAREKDAYCFVEVKTRRSDRFGLPQEAVLNTKQKQIAKSALVFLKENKLLGKRARFDVVSVLYSQGSPRMSLIKNAFELNERFTY
jgi:putative endonuclease